MFKFFLAALSVCVFSSAAFAQMGPCQHPWTVVSEPQPFERRTVFYIKDLTVADAYTSIVDRYAIKLPKNFAAHRSIPCTPNNRYVGGSKLIWFALEAEFYVTKLAAVPDATGKVRNLTAEDIKTDIMSIADRKIISEMPVNRGLQIKFEGRDYTGITQSITDGDDAFIITAIMPKGVEEYEKLALGVIGSFKTFTRAERKQYLDRKMAEGTPKPLPQTPVAARAESDTQEQKLKGAVRTVTTHIEELDGMWAKAGKRLQSVDYFDTRGNSTKYVWFWEDAATSITVFGYLDGARVSLMNEISDDSGKSMMITMDGPEKPPPPHAPDPRYSEKFTYKYDAKKRMIEKAVFKNDGERESLTAYKYTANGIELTEKDSSGEVIRKTIFTLDDKQNPVQEITKIFGPYSSETRSIYKYETFDNQGNWTKRKVSSAYLEGGKWIDSDSSIEHRTITYHP